MRLSGRIRDARGYSMIEVVVATMILTAGILPMAAMFDAAHDLGRSSSDLDEMRYAASSALEEIRALDYPEMLSRYGMQEDGAPCPESVEGDGLQCLVMVESLGEDFDPIAAPGTRSRLTVSVSGDGRNYEASVLLTASAP